MTSKTDGHARPATVTVIMPFRDEEATLRLAIEQLLQVDLETELEVIAVDDGSTDGSVGSIAPLLSDPRIRLISEPVGRGKGYAVRLGLSEASGDIVAILDADLEYRADDLALLVAAIVRGEATVAYGIRPPGRKSFYSFWYMVGGRLTSLWASLVFGIRVRDMHTALKVASREMWNSIQLHRNGFDLDTEITAKFLRSGHRILEIPVNYKARSRSEGKKLRWTAGLTSLWVITETRLRRQGEGAGLPIREKAKGVNLI